MHRPSRVPRLRTALAAGLLFAGVAWSFSACGPRAPEVAGLPETVDFNFHVRPVLSDRCFACHGPDDRARKAGLRLDTRDGAFAKLPSGRTAIVAGSPRRSELVRRILSTDPKVLMPAPESHLTLTDYERAVLVRWIEQGAEWKPHWAFMPPGRPSPPKVDAHTALDAFVRAALRGQGLSPSPEAPREVLIRRVTFDLTGLPPTPQEIDAFLADTAPGAYERLVDRLLASSAYGERMAAEWLDVARYADSHGYQDDGMRDMSPWRDWVIGAFNRNMPFDQFITWQLAGDLLPAATDEQQLATAFNRNHMQSQEGGIVPEEYRVEYVADRVNTLGRAFLGVTMECARCHDHKYDPVTQREYFELFDFFNHVNETGQVPYAGMPSPTIVIKDETAERTLAQLRAEIREREAEASIENAAFDAGFATWLSAARARPSQRLQPKGLLAHLPLDAPTKTTEFDREKKVYKPVFRFANTVTPTKRATLGGDKDRAPATVEGREGVAQQLVGDSYIDLGPKTAHFERHDQFSVALWFRVDKPGAHGPLVTRSGGVMNGNRGFEVMLLEDGTLTAGLHHVFPDNSIEIRTTRPVQPGAWHHVAMTYDGSSRASGSRLFLDGTPAATEVLADNLFRSIVHKGDGTNWGDMPGLRVGKRHDETLADVTVDELRLYGDQLTAIEAAAVAGASDSLGEALRAAGDPVPGATDGATEAARVALREHYVRRVDPGYARTRTALRALRGRENALLTALPEVMVMRERSRPRQSYLLARGAYDAPTDPVQAATPRHILPFPADLPKNRLGLARWLVSPKHPLTARVIVNRYWALFFGTGIVATPEDFGSQGELPTHPELLDYLATSFIESGWNLKALQKQIVTSATYRQSSVADASAQERDGGNRWLARGPSYRRSAEQIRDNALAASGLLVRKVGGPSVYPYQPAGLWEELATRNATTYVQGKGDDLYRRSLYTVWKRTTPPPSAISFDAAERLFCTVRRQRTSTPLQSLVLMNDPQYVEAARVLGERMVREGGASAEERITFGFRLLTSRRPTPKELAVLRTLHDEERARFAADPAAAVGLLEAGEHPRDARLPAAEAAACAVVASTMLSLDEAVNKR